MTPTTICRTCQRLISHAQNGDGRWKEFHVHDRFGQWVISGTGAVRLAGVELEFAVDAGQVLFVPHFEGACAGKRRVAA